MLIAERSALRGDDDSGLSQHLQECLSCRRLAAMIENETAVLAAAVRREPAKQDSRALTRQRTRNAILVTVLPIAATIAMAAVLQHRGDADNHVQATPLSANERLGMNAVSVDVERGQTATVIRTKDPNVTIVWISPGGTQ
jgi:hypothetical protein